MLMCCRCNVRTATATLYRPGWCDAIPACTPCSNVILSEWARAAADEEW